MMQLLRPALAVLLPTVLLPKLLTQLADLAMGARARRSMECTAPELPLAPAEEPELGTLGMLHVVYSTDGVDQWGLIISMISLARHVSDPGQCTIHIITTAVAATQLDHLLWCFRKDLEDLPAIPAVNLLPERPCNMSDGTSPTGFYQTNCSQRFVRYCLQDYLPAAPRVLWVDTDVVFHADVRPLYQMRMRHAVAGVKYTPYTNLRQSMDQMLQFGSLPFTARSRHLEPYLESQHINAGIMLFDLTKWKSGAITTALLRWIQTLGEQVCMNQAVLNVFFRTAFDELDWRWNVMVPRRVGAPQRCLDAANAIHWAGPIKPWHPGGWSMHRELLGPYVPTRC